MRSKRSGKETAVVRILPKTEQVTASKTRVAPSPITSITDAKGLGAPHQSRARLSRRYFCRRRESAAS